MDRTEYRQDDEIVFQGPGGPRVKGVVLEVRELTMNGPDGFAIVWLDIKGGFRCTHNVTDPRISKI